MENVEKNAFFAMDFNERKKEGVEEEIGGEHTGDRGEGSLGLLFVLLFVNNEDELKKPLLCVAAVGMKWHVAREVEVADSG